MRCLDGTDGVCFFYHDPECPFYTELTPFDGICNFEGREHCQYFLKGNDKSGMKSIEIDSHTYRMLEYFVKNQEYPYASYSEVIKCLIYAANWDKGTPFEDKIFKE